MTAPDSVLLPEGTRLVHIGPHKTGTSALQGAFYLARRAAAAQGVHYAGPIASRRTPRTRSRPPATQQDPKALPSRPWRRLLAEIEAARETRVVVSSEWFSDATPGIRLLVSGLDPDRVHIGIPSKGWPDAFHGDGLDLSGERAATSYAGVSTDRVVGVLASRVRAASSPGDAGSGARCHRAERRRRYTPRRRWSHRSRG